MAYGSDRRVLVTGATGFIGRAVIPRLLAEGAQVLALTTRPQRVKELWDIETADIIREADRLLTSTISRFEPDSLLHLAWSRLPDYSADACLSNVEASMRVIRLALIGGVSRFVGAGSCWEYGDLQGLLSEDMTIAPRSLFAQSKSCIQEMMARAAAESGAEARWARIFYAYGPGQRETSLIPTAVKAWLAGSPPDLRDTARAIDLILVDDVAAGLATLTLREGPSGVFNLGSGSAVRVADIVEHVRGQVQAARPAVAPGPTTSGGAAWADIGRMRQSFGWEPHVSLTDGIRLVISEWTPATPTGNTSTGNG